jgi:hypothetical protein
MATSNDVLSEMVFPQTGQTSGAAQAPYSVTPTGSPFVYRATARVALYVTGGTVTAAAYGRGPTSLALGLLSGGQMFELNAGDTLTLTYLTTPTITVIPR